MPTPFRKITPLRRFDDRALSVSRCGTRAPTAMLGMTKIDVATLRKAAAG